MSGRPVAMPAKFVYAGLLLLVLAAVLRSWQLDSQEVWMDEAFSALIGQLEGPRFLAALRLESNPPLYFLLLKAFSTLFGYSPVAMRSLSVLISVATVAVVLFYGARLVGWRFAFGAGLFLTLSPYSIYYAQEARGYALLMLLVMVAMLSAYDAVTTRSKRAIWLSGFCVLAAGYTHYFAALALAPLPLFLIWRYFRNEEERSTVRWLLLTQIASALLCALWMLPRLTNRNVDPQLWVTEQWAHLDKLWIVPKSLLVLLLGSSQGMTPLFMKQETLLAQPVMQAVLVSVAAAGLLILALMRRQPVDAAPQAQRSTGILLIVATLMPLGILYAVSFLKPLYVIGRYDAVAFPWLVVLAGWVAVRCARLPWPTRAAFIALVLTLFGGMLHKDALHVTAARAYHDFDAERSADLLGESVADGDLLVFTGMRGTSVIYYLSRKGFRWDGEHCRNEARRITLTCRILPYSDAGVPFLMGITATTPVSVRSAAADFERILGARRADSTVWILYSRQREPANLAIDREIERSLRHSRLVPFAESIELARYRIRRLHERVS